MQIQNKLLVIDCFSTYSLKYKLLDNISDDINVVKKRVTSYRVLTVFQFDNLFALYFHTCYNGVQYFCQIISGLLVARVFDLLTQIFTLAGTHIQ